MLGVDVFNGKEVHKAAGTSTSITIDKNYSSNPCQAILFVASNSYGGNSMPSIFVLPRTNSTEIGVVYEGNVKKEHLSIDSNGVVTLAVSTNTHVYYRVFCMEIN